jgi:hypothetical protein
MTNTKSSIEWHPGKNHSIGYVRCSSGRRRALYYVQKNAMDWILDRECVRVARGSTMDELQAIAEQNQQKIENELLHIPY